MVAKYASFIGLMTILSLSCQLSCKKRLEVQTDAQRIAAITSISAADKKRLVIFSTFKPREIKKVGKEQITFFIVCTERSTGKADASDVMGLVSQVVGSSQFEAVGIPDESWIRLAQSTLNSCEKAPNLTERLQIRHQLDALKYASNVKNPKKLKIMESYKGHMVNKKVENRLLKLLS